MWFMKIIEKTIRNCKRNMSLNTCFLFYQSMDRMNESEIIDLETPSLLIFDKNYQYFLVFICFQLKTLNTANGFT